MGVARDESLATVARDESLATRQPLAPMLFMEPTWKQATISCGQKTFQRWPHTCYPIGPSLSGLLLVAIYAMNYDFLRTLQYAYICFLPSCTYNVDIIIHVRPCTYRYTYMDVCCHCLPNCYCCTICRCSINIV